MRDLIGHEVLKRDLPLLCNFFLFVCVKVMKVVIFNFQIFVFIFKHKIWSHNALEAVEKIGEDIFVNPTEEMN